jgi:Bacterial toxin 24
MSTETLDAEHELTAPQGQHQYIAAIHTYVGAKPMRNLIATTHTYYVIAGNTPVLVHNDDDPGPRARGANLPPDPNATGDHTVFERDENDRIRRYQTWYQNDRNPNGWDKGPRFRGDGGPHSGMEPPLYYEKGGGKAVPATDNQLPTGYGNGGC